MACTRCEFTSCNGYPGAGALLPVAYRVVFLNNLAQDGDMILDMLITSNISSRVTLGFRFYPATQGYLSPSAINITFTTTVPLVAGNFLRLRFADPVASGLVLEQLTYPTVCEPPVEPFTEVATSAIQLTAGIAYRTCFIYWVPQASTTCPSSCAKIQGIAAIASAGEDAEPFMPPTCALPCNFSFVPRYDTVTPDVSQIIVAPQLRVRDAWVAAWRTLRTDAWDIVGTSTEVEAVESTAYIAFRQGALLPVAFRPHVADTAFPAELALVTTLPIYANSSFCITGVPADPPTPFWIWRAPADVPVIPVGTTIYFRNLGITTSFTPTVNVGTVVRYYTTPTDEDLSEFTVFSVNPCDFEENIDIITALYTCSNYGPAPGLSVLTPGLTMYGCLWPNEPSILCKKFCGCIPRPGWVEELMCAPVARWSCQPVPEWALCNPCGLSRSDMVPFGSTLYCTAGPGISGCTIGCAAPYGYIQYAPLG